MNVGLTDDIYKIVNHEWGEPRERTTATAERVRGGRVCQLSALA